MFRLWRWKRNRIEKQKALEETAIKVARLVIDLIRANIEEGGGGNV